MEALSAQRLYALEQGCLCLVASGGSTWKDALVWASCSLLKTSEFQRKAVQGLKDLKIPHPTPPHLQHIAPTPVLWWPCGAYTTCFPSQANGLMGVFLLPVQTDRSTGLWETNRLSFAIFVPSNRAAVLIGSQTQSGSQDLV